MQGMKRKIVKHAVWNEDDVAALEPIANGPNQLGVKLFQVSERGAMEVFGHRIRKQRGLQLAQLKAQEAQGLRHRGHAGKRNNVQCLSGYDRGDDTLAEKEVLDDNLAAMEGGANFVQREMAVQQPHARSGLGLRNFAQNGKEFLFARLRVNPQIVEALSRIAARAQLFQLDAVLIPVQLFAKIANLVDEVALAGARLRKRMAALNEELHETARFRQLDIAESFFARNVLQFAVDAELDEPLVKLRPVFHEGNLELVAAQRAAEPFELHASALIGGICVRMAAARLFDLAQEEESLIAEDGRIHIFQRRERARALRKSLRNIAGADGNLRQDEVAESGFALQKGIVEEGCGGHGKTAGLEVAALVEKNDGLIQVDEPGPDFILLFNEQGASLGKQFQCVACLTLLAEGDGAVGKGFGGFVTDLHALKEMKALLGDFLRFRAQIELNIDIRQIEIAEGNEVVIADSLASQPGGLEHFDGPAVIAAQVVKVGDVVVGDEIDER